MARVANDCSLTKLDEGVAVYHSANDGAVA